MYNKKSMEALNRLSAEEFKSKTDKTPILIVLDNVRSMNNVGSVFRTADGFCAEEIILCGFTPQPPHRDISKTALGATETVAWKYFSETIAAINFLKENNYIILAIEQVHNSISLENFKIEKNKKYAFVFGNEVEGVSEEAIALCDASIEIPQLGSKHSFNISVSAGIVMWQFFQGLQLSH